ncbi:MAG TPA: SIS domain-containing protein, partial [Bacteroidales bacterium]|nr:SIS domain-containing protein [Bacteroidales bacterium]
MENINRIKEIFKQSINLKNAILSNKKFLSLISEIVDKIVLSLQSGGKVLLCGNGGSAADAQHIAAELSGKFYFDRPPLPAEALHVNTSFLTAVANDYSYEQVFSRMLK